MDNLNGFKKWDIYPNTIIEGASIYVKEIFFDVPNDFKNRLIRVYLPSTYDFSNPDNRYPVLYMMDGKNLFDDYTSFVGEWGIDESIEEMIKNKESKGIIVVGIDAPNENIARSREMTPPDLVLRKKVDYGKGYADIFGEFILKVVKPLIDDTFYTLKDKNHTAVGGSSMGGLMAYCLYHRYKDYVGYSLSFSPAFFLFKNESFISNRREVIKYDNSLGKIYFYVGEVGFESLFTKTTKETYEYFKSIGFNDDEVKLVIDPHQEHNEKAWRIYFPDAIRYFNYFYN